MRPRRFLLVALAGALIVRGAGAAVPGEVAAVRVEGDVVSWAATGDATSYNVYRGYLRDLTSTFLGTTLEGGMIGTSLTDSVDPSPGAGFFYLVTAANTDGEGTLGTDAAGAPRVNTYPWPGLAVAGRWSGLQNWPCNSVNLALMRYPGDPKRYQIMTYEGQPAPSETFVWDPVAGTQTAYETTTNIFCSGGSFLADGRLLATGGDLAAPNAWGMPTIWTFDPADPGWVRGPDMARGRYYPTQVELGDGRTLIFGGIADGITNDDIESYSPSPEQVQYLGQAYPEVGEYTHMLLQEDGKIFQAGPNTYTHTYDPTTGVWTFIAKTNYGFRTAGQSVPLPNSRRILTLGGYQSHPNPTATAEIIDLAAPAPSWRYITPMKFPRMNHNAVMLPDGKLLVVGGGYDETVAVYPSELFDPVTESWSMMASMHSHRLYHSTAALLPDGRVIATGSNYNYTAEFYSPGYLFRGPRPVITNAPASVNYGQPFGVATPSPASITSVVFMRPAATTHGFDQDHHFVPLSFGPVGGNLSVVAPTNRNVAPPGYYMLFLLNASGVPSEAWFVQLM
ncbi:MAG TPA: galactose oxidase-like domain-containing protein [Candidatus Polarisedimenticolaceae bacterium]